MPERKGCDGDNRPDCNKAPLFPQYFVGNIGFHNGQGERVTLSLYERQQACRECRECSKHHPFRSCRFRPVQTLTTLSTLLVNDKRSSHLKLIDPDTFEDQMPWQYNDAWPAHSRTGPRPPWPRHCCMYWHQGSRTQRTQRQIGEHNPLLIVSP